ncbi:hypothetical protein LC040_18205 [Bacillus tianshenii]|nr:hypothetical protein LC040_18205 [Bacillus tianshenii]
MDLEKYYINLMDKSKNILIESFKSKSNFSNCHAFLDDLDNWITILSERYEKQLYLSAINEYQRSLYLVLQGSYRQAFIALRFFIEHTCAAIYFSVREIDYRFWTKGQLDISWSKVTDRDLGVFSKKYISLYFEGLSEYYEQFDSLAKKLYRECSEYTHGNYITYQHLDHELKYNQELFDKFIETAQNVNRLITFILTARFWNSMDFKQRNKLESSITDYIGFTKYFAYQMPLESEANYV